MNRMMGNEAGDRPDPLLQNSSLSSVCRRTPFVDFVPAAGSLSSSLVCPALPEANPSPLERDCHPKMCR